MNLRQRVIELFIIGIRRLERATLQSGGDGWCKIDLPCKGQMRMPQPRLRESFEEKGVTWWRIEVTWGEDKVQEIIGVMDFRVGVDGYTKEGPDRDSLEAIAERFESRWKRWELHLFRLSIDRLLSMEINSEEIQKLLNEAIVESVDLS